jgi:hypothetical protein
MRRGSAPKVTIGQVSLKTELLRRTFFISHSAGKRMKSFKVVLRLHTRSVNYLDATRKKKIFPAWTICTFCWLIKRQWKTCLRFLKGITTFVLLQQFRKRHYFQRCYIFSASSCLQFLAGDNFKNLADMTKFCPTKNVSYLLCFHCITCVTNSELQYLAFSKKDYT